MQTCCEDGLGHLALTVLEIDIRKRTTSEGFSTFIRPGRLVAITLLSLLS
jgi:hypothetical protein